jgi:hypothetical protein
MGENNPFEHLPSKTVCHGCVSRDFHNRFGGDKLRSLLTVQWHIDNAPTST